MVDHYWKIKINKKTTFYLNELCIVQFKWSLYIHIIVYYSMLVFLLLAKYIFMPSSLYAWVGLGLSHKLSLNDRVSTVVSKVSDLVDYLFSYLWYFIDWKYADYFLFAFFWRLFICTGRVLKYKNVFVLGLLYMFVLLFIFEMKKSRSNIRY